MARKKGEDTSRDPNRRVDNIVYADFGHPMKDHPAFQARKLMSETMPEAINIMDLMNLPANHPIFKHAMGQERWPESAYAVSEEDEPNIRPNKVSDIEFNQPESLTDKTSDDANPFGIQRPDLSGIKIKDDD